MWSTCPVHARFSPRRSYFVETAVQKQKHDETYYSTKSADQREMDFYGYRWENEQEISALSFNNGLPQEYCGWFTSLDVEYLKDGQWHTVKNLSISPGMNLDNNQWLKAAFIDYDIRFNSCYRSRVDR